MKKHQTVFPVAAMVLLVSSLFASGCATAPSVSGDDVSTISVALVTADELKSRFGRTYDDNPYLPAISFLGGQKEEFIVLKIDIGLPEPDSIYIATKAEGPDGTSLAVQKDILQMESYWDFVRGADERKVQKRYSTLRRCYLPTNPYSMVAGRHTYYLVLMGKNPIPRPANVMVQVALGSGEVKSFEFALPDLPAKK